MTTLARFTNENDGLEVVVTKGASGWFHAAFRDTDADQVIEVRIFPTLTRATAWAESFGAQETVAGASVPVR